MHIYTYLLHESLL